MRRDGSGASRCHGWTALDVVVHVRVGLQEMLGFDSIMWTRRTSSAYHRPHHALEHLRDAADAAALAATAMAPGPVVFHGQVLADGDFLATWAVELAVHHLDLGDAGFGGPSPESLRLGRDTVEALAGVSLPAAWSDRGCMLAGSGRVGAAPGVPSPVLG